MGELELGSDKGDVLDIQAALRRSYLSKLLEQFAGNLIVVDQILIGELAQDCHEFGLRGEGRQGSDSGEYLLEELSWVLDSGQCNLQLALVLNDLSLTLEEGFEELSHARCIGWLHL